MYKENLGFSQPERLDFAIIISVVLVTQSCPTLCNPMNMEFSRPEYCSGQPFPSPGDLPDPGDRKSTRLNSSH